jgi:hypothetical protein
MDPLRRARDQSPRAPADVDETRPSRLRRSAPPVSRVTAPRLGPPVGGTLAIVFPLVRFGLPAVIATVGVALVVFGDDAARGAGVVLIGVALLVVLANLFIRLALSSERDRDRESQRRRRL